MRLMVTIFALSMLAITAFVFDNPPYSRPALATEDILAVDAQPWALDGQKMQVPISLTVVLTGSDGSIQNIVVPLLVSHEMAVELASGGKLMFVSADPDVSALATAAE